MRCKSHTELSDQRPQPPVDVMPIAPREHPPHALALGDGEQKLENIGVEWKLLPPPRLLVVEGEHGALDVHMQPVH